MQIHLLDPQLHNHTITGSIRFRDLEGKLLQFQTSQRPAKRAFAFHAQVALHHARGRRWPAAQRISVPEHAWSSEGCPKDLQERYFVDQLQLVDQVQLLDQMQLVGLTS